MLSQQRVVVCDLGRVPYEPAWNLQKKIQAHLVRAKRETPPREVDHVMLFVEHPPVYTLGKSGDARHLLVPEAQLERAGASYFHIDRGGDITFHGPGQLVAYPILDLDRLNPDIHRYLRNLEEAVIRVCADYGVEAGRVEGKTGVWVPASKERAARKICAMGIRCSRWVTMHGFAFNLNTDLSFFSNIVPCGISDGEVTTLAREIERSVDVKEARRRTAAHFASIFGVEIIELEKKEAKTWIASFLDETVEALMG